MNITEQRTPQQDYLQAKVFVELWNETKWKNSWWKQRKRLRANYRNIVKNLNIIIL